MQIGSDGTSGEGGYDDGYSDCPCFWGKLPGSLVKEFLQRNGSLAGCRVLDLGCGEGKNASAFALAGATVDAVDCSALAIANGRRAFPNADIRWIRASAAAYLRASPLYDLIVMYGLLHCLPSSQEISRLLALATEKTSNGGTHIVVAFNDGPHDLSAHPNFKPTLVPHEFYLAQYGRHDILGSSTSILHESHPNNNIPHFHSITRLTARIAHVLPR
jgi:tellurite methyltransferase